MGCKGYRKRLKKKREAEQEREEQRLAQEEQRRVEEEKRLHGKRGYTCMTIARHGGKKRKKDKRVKENVTTLPEEIVQQIVATRIYDDSKRSYSLSLAEWDWAMKRGDWQAECRNNLSNLLLVNRAMHDYVRNFVRRDGRNTLAHISPRPMRIILRALSIMLTSTPNVKLFRQYQKAILRWWPLHESVHIQMDLTLQHAVERGDERYLASESMIASGFLLPSFRSLASKARFQMARLLVEGKSIQDREQQRQRLTFVVLACVVFASFIKNGDRLFLCVDDASQSMELAAFETAIEARRKEQDFSYEKVIRFIGSDSETDIPRSGNSARSDSSGDATETESYESESESETSNYAES